MLHFDDKLCFDHPPRKPGGAFPHEKPRYTMTEEVEHTAQMMRETVERLLKFEERMTEKVEDHIRTISSDNVIFKSTVRETWATFLESVKNEVNVFEGNVDAAISLFQKDMESNYATLSEDVHNQIQNNLDNFMDKVGEFEATYEQAFEAYKDTINNRLDSYNTNYAQTFATFQANTNLRMDGFEADMQELFTEFQNTLTGSVNDSLSYVENRLDAQDAKVSDAELFMKTNLNTSLESLLDEMHSNGELVGIIDSSVLTSVKHYGAVGDGVTDDTAAINAALASGKKTVYFPYGTYVVKPSSFTAHAGYSPRIGLAIPSGVTILGCNSTIKVDAGTLENDLIVLASANYRSAAYESDAEKVSGINVYDLTIDGNTANLGNANSITGLAFAHGDNITVNNITMKNLCGGDGEGYGIIFAYCNNCSFTNSIVERSSRSNVYCWESQNVECRNLKLYGSTYRDCVTCGSNAPLALQKSTIHFDNCHMEHLFASGTHVARFTAYVDAVIENCKIIANGNVDGIASPRGIGEVNLIVRNCDIQGGTTGVNFTGENTFSRFEIDNCKVKSNIALFASLSDYITLRNNLFESTGSAAYGSVNGKSVTLDTNTFKGGTHVTVAVGNYGLISRNILDGLTGENGYIITGDGYVILSENISSNAEQKARILCSGKAINNRMAIDSTTVGTNEHNE